MRTVDEFIVNRNFSVNFTGVWMVIAEWRDIPAFPGTNPTVVSFAHNLFSSLKYFYISVTNA